MSIEKNYSEYWKEISGGYFDRKTPDNEIIMAYLFTRSEDLLQELYCRSIINWSNTDEEWLDKIKPVQCKNCVGECSNCGLQNMYIRDPKTGSLINKALFLK